MTDAPIHHFVNKAEFNPDSVTELSPAQERFYMASQWQLMWWKLRRHRLAVISGAFLLLIYLSIVISEILAPYNLQARNTRYLYAPPQSVHLFDKGEFVGPFVYGMNVSLNLERLQWTYSEDTSKVQKIRFLCSGDDYSGATYSFWGLFPGSLHLFCPAKDGQLFLLVLDRAIAGPGTLLHGVTMAAHVVEAAAASPGGDQRRFPATDLSFDRYQRNPGAV